MRFSIFAAFVLPLAALAAPTPAGPTDQQKQVAEAFGQVNANIIETFKGVNSTLIKAVFLTSPVQVDLVNAVKVLLFDGLKKVETAGKLAKDAVDADPNSFNRPQNQADVIQGIVNIQQNAKALNTSIANSDLQANDKTDLTGFLTQTLYGAADVLAQSQKAATAQGKSIKDLFVEVSIPPPPEFA